MRDVLWKPICVTTSSYTWKQTWRFPVRPQPYPDESIAGYLVRIACANGYGSIRALLSAARKHDEDTFVALAKGLRLQRSVLAKLRGPLPVTKTESRDSVRQAGSRFNFHYMRWCPLCVVEQAYLRAAWSGVFACCCTKHGVWLRETCPACGERQVLLRSDVEHCQCGAKLAGAASVAAPEKLLKIQAALECSQASGALTANLPQLTLPGWFRLIRYMGQFELSKDPARPGQVAGLHRMEVASRLLMSVAELLKDWPLQFEALLLARQRVSVRSTSIRKTFGLLYRTIYKDLAEAEFQFLRDAFEEHLNRCWWGTINRRNRRLSTATITTHPKLTLKQIARESKLQPALIRTFVRGSQIKSEGVRFPSGRTA